MAEVRERLSDDELYRAAVDVLNVNRTSRGTKASPHLYPHQWSWDAAFIAMGLAVFDPNRARDEMDFLFAGQWSNGMIPHIVFNPDAHGYFPGPERWECHKVSTHAPAGVATSGIMQPPVHALALQAIMDADTCIGNDIVHEWHRNALDHVVAWHRYLHNERIDPATGLITLFHGWESGMDNSHRWDDSYRNVVPQFDLPPYTRRDTGHVGSIAERPDSIDYDRYIWLLEEGKRVGYEALAWKQAGSFRVGDVFATALFSAASDSAAECAEDLHCSDVAHEMRDMADAARVAVTEHCDMASGCAYDVDLRSGKPLCTQTIAGFAPLLCLQAGTKKFDAARRTLFSSEWCGRESLALPLPPSTSPSAPVFEAERYWRGPVWPIMNWVLGWGLARAGDITGAIHLRKHGLDELREGSFAEYYDPFSGKPLGSHGQSWTAAAALLWLSAFS